jgi:hypothetical protein
MIPAVLGLGFLFFEDRKLAGGLVLVFAATVYQIAAFGMYGGAGAGQRYLINMTFPAAFGLAACMSFLSKRISIDWVAAAIGGFIILNMGLLSAYALGIIPQMGRGVVFKDFVWDVMATGPVRMIEFMNHITYFNKSAFSIGATIFEFVVNRTFKPLQLLSGLYALVIVGFVGSLACYFVLRSLVLDENR